MTSNRAPAPAGKAGPILSSSTTETTAAAVRGVLFRDYRGGGALLVMLTCGSGCPAGNAGSGGGRYPGAACLSSSPQPRALRTLAARRRLLLLLLLPRPPLLLGLRRAKGACLAAGTAAAAAAAADTAAAAAAAASAADVGVAAATGRGRSWLMPSPRPQASSARKAVVRRVPTKTLSLSRPVAVLRAESLAPPGPKRGRSVLLKTKDTKMRAKMSLGRVKKAVGKQRRSQGKPERVAESRSQEGPHTAEDNNARNRRGRVAEKIRRA